MGQIIAIVSQKGGVGKTSTAVNLGACISAIKRKVLLVGVDPQCGLAKSFGLEPEDVPIGMLDVLRDGTAPQDAIYPANPRLPHLSFIPSNVKSISDESFYCSVLQQDSTMLGRFFERLRPSYDFIFLDCPPRMDNPTYAALIAADSYMVPVQCEYASMSTVGRVLRAALEVKRLHNTRLAIFGFLLTMADKRAGFTVKVVQEVRQYLRDHVFRTIVPRDPRLAEVPYRQAPVIAFDMQSPGAKAYIQLAREVLAGNQGPKGRMDDSRAR